MSNFYFPFIGLLVMHIVCVLLIIFLYLILYKRRSLSIRSMALSFFIVFFVVGVIAWGFTRQNWYLVIAIFEAVLGAVFTSFLPWLFPGLKELLRKG